MIDPSTFARLPLLATVSPGAIATLATRAIERRYGSGQTLYLTGTAPPGLLLVLEGRVRIVRGRDGRQHTVHEEGPGGALGEIPVFGGGGYPATAVAAEPTRCALLTADAIRLAVRQDPELAFVFLERLARRARHLVDRVAGLAGRDVQGRLARLLLQREADGGTAGFLVGRTQHEVAEELGTVREVVVRALRRLRRAGVIQATGRGRYRVADRAALTRLAD